MYILVSFQEPGTTTYLVTPLMAGVLNTVLQQPLNLDLMLLHESLPLEVEYTAHV